MKKFWLQCLAVTVFVFFMMWVVSKLSDLKGFSEFDTISKALQDTELTDYAFNNLREDPRVDERIILVNIGQLSRGEIARQIQIISESKPRVIAIDVFFGCEGGLRDSINCPQLLDTLGNLLLSNAIKEAGNVVMGEKLMQTDSLAKFDSDIADSLQISDAIFSDYSKEGFTSLPTNATYQEDVKICRSIWPKKMIKGKRELAFSVQTAMQYDSNKANRFLARDKEEEIINYRGNIEVLRHKTNSLKNKETNTTNYPTMFFVVEYDDLFKGNFVPEMFKDKIVIMGYLGDYLGDSAWEDKFYTPMNKKIGGRANPDMFGMVVHANAIAMILNEDFIDELTEWQKNVIAFVLCLFTVALFAFIDKKLPIWYDALSVIIQIALILLIMTLIVEIFAHQNLKLDLSLTILVFALVGPCYDIFKSLQNEIISRLSRRKEKLARKSIEITEN
jgi:CHASE2 domain-containing sensor protein